MQLPLRVALVIAIILIAGAGATPASAGVYAVYACDPAHGNVNNSWQSYSNRRGILVYAACTRHRGSLGAWDQGLVTRAMVNRRNKQAKIPRGASARWMFRAPPGAKLMNLSFVGSGCGTLGHASALLVDEAMRYWWYNSPDPTCRAAPRRMHLPLLGNTAALRTWCAGRPLQGRRRNRTGLGQHAIDRDARDRLHAPGDQRHGRLGRRARLEARGRDVRVRHERQRGHSSRIDRRGRSRAACLRLDMRPHPHGAVPDGEQPAAVSTRIAPDGLQPFVSAPPTRRATCKHTLLGRGRQHRSRPADWPVGGRRLGMEFDQLVRCRVAQPRGAGYRAHRGRERGCVPGVGGCRGLVRLHFEPTRSSDEVLTGLRVPREGQWMARVWLRDAAGNEDRRTAQAVPLNLDSTPPSVAFASIDETDPTRIDVRAADATSPIVRTEIEARRRGDAAWIPLPTGTTTTGFSSRLDDESLPNGEYSLRARATDSAGNERSTDREASGKVALRNVPLRVNTRLVAGQVKTVKGRRTRGGRRRTRRVIIVRPKVPFGGTIPIRGRLTMPGENAIADAGIEVWERLWIRGAVPRRVAVIGTDDSGRFVFKALSGPSRTLRFRYPGTAVVRARSAEVDIRVRAASTIRVNRRRVVNGEDIVLSGRVRGGPLPTVGKLVQLQAYSRGRWLTFATPRADRGTGRWSYRYRFTSTRGTVRYRFRARVPQEAGFPYIVGHSHSLRVVVRGL